MPSFKDTLAILITGDAKQFVAEVEKAGTAAEANLGKAEAAQGRLSDKMVKGGAVMVGVGAVMAFGLAKAIGAAHEHELATIKLDNSIEHMSSRLPGAKARMEEYANAIQDHTTVSNEDAMAVEAQLIQFGLTEGQVKKLLPLVVDLSEKTGKGLAASATAVGKAVEGTAGGLKRMGIIVDANAFATDHYGAVLDTLRGKVGGFAAKEAKTFEGQLQQVGNKLHDLEEEIGAGATPVVEGLVGVVSKGVSVLHDFDGVSGNLVGKVLAIGTIGTIATGGVLLLAGAVQKVTLAFTEGALAGTAWGAAVQAAAGGAVGAMAAVAVQQLGKEAWNSLIEQSDEARANVVKFGGDGKRAIEEFDAAISSHDLNKWNPFSNPGDIVKGFQNAFGHIRDDGEQTRQQVMGEFDKIAKASPSVAQHLLQSLRGDKDARDKIGFLFDNMERSIGKVTKARADEANAAQRDAEMTRQAALASGDAQQINDALTKSIQDLQKAEDEDAKKKQTFADATWSAIDAQRSLDEAGSTLRATMADGSKSLDERKAALEGVVKAAGDNAAQQLGPGATAAAKTEASLNAQIGYLGLLKKAYPSMAPTIDDWTASLLKNVQASQQSNSTDQAAIGVLDGLKAKYPGLAGEIDKLEAKVRAKNEAQAAANSTDSAAEQVLEGLKAKYPQLAGEIDNLLGKIHNIEGNHRADIEVYAHVNIGAINAAVAQAVGSVATGLRGLFGGHGAAGISLNAPRGVPQPMVAHGGEVVLDAGTVDQAVARAKSGRSTRSGQYGDGGGAGEVHYHEWNFYLSAIDARGMRRAIVDALAEHARTSGRGELQRIVLGKVA